LQTLSLKLWPRQLKRWPRQEAERWGGWFLFGLFALILLWEELWDLQNTAYLSSCLLLLITAGAIIFSQIFERRFWCRYLCPIGGMNGLYAKLSMTELRAQQGTCSAECTTYQCYKGGPAKGEGQETGGCPIYSHPAQLEENRDCVLCMTCLKACPHRSVEFNLRPPGIELWTTHTPRAY
jgi:polyferredoxin